MDTLISELASLENIVTDVVEIMKGFPELSKARISIISGMAIVHTKVTQSYCDHSRPQIRQPHLQRSITAGQLSSVEIQKNSETCGQRYHGHSQIWKLLVDRARSPDLGRSVLYPGEAVENKDIKLE